MLKKVDFLLVYEHKMRELENLCLLAVELENRGYSTEIVGCTDLARKIKPIYDVVVIVVPGALNNVTFDYCLGRFAKFKKIVSMPSEQVITENKEIGNLEPIETIGKDAIYITWGDYFRRHLIERSNCDPEKIQICGHISMDFWKEAFNSYYDSEKTEVAKRYNLDINKNWNIFISSLVLQSLTEEEIEKLMSITGRNNIWEKYKIEVQTKNNIFSWFENKLKEDQNQYIIYRPHPAERKTLELIELEKKYSNFKIIEEGSVRQWIAMCTRIFTWVSTSIVDVYFAKKNCHILRPVELPMEFDAPIFKNAIIIKDEEGFKETFSEQEEKKFPLSMKLLSDYYDISNNYSYKLVANICEKVIKNSEYDVNPKNLEEFHNYQKYEWKKKKVKEKILLCLKNNDLIFQIYLFVIKHKLIPWLKNRNRLRSLYKEEKSIKEIRLLKEKIRAYVEIS